MLRMLKCAWAHRHESRAPRRSSRVIAACCAAFLTLAQHGHLRAATVTQATGSRTARQAAVRALPLDKLSGELRAKVSRVVSKPTIFRRLPIEVTDCDPNLYLFLVKHPEVVVNIWEVMGISKVTLTRTGEGTYEARDGSGTTGTLTYGYSDHDTQLIYAEGAYEGPLFSRPLKARCVLLLKSAYMQETNGRYYVTSRLDTFIQIENAGIDLLAKSFHPLVIKSADYNFTETAGFVGTISRTAELKPQGMLRLNAKLTQLEPKVRNRFAELTLGVAEDARARGATQLALRPSSSESKKAKRSEHR